MYVYLNAHNYTTTLRDFIHQWLFWVPAKQRQAENVIQSQNFTLPWNS